jgi:Kef-type K+ transport system membrane component KefB
MGWNDAFQLGALMNTRGLVELIVLNIGLDLRILSPRIFTMMVVMALVTTCMTGPLLSLADLARKKAFDARAIPLEP